MLDGSELHEWIADAGLNAASGVMQSDNFIDGMTSAATKAIESAKGNAGQLGSLARTFLLSQLPGINQSTNELLARGQGAVLNLTLNSCSTDHLLDRLPTVSVCQEETAKKPS